MIASAFADGTEGLVFTNEPVTQFNPMKLPPGVVGVLGAGNFDAPTDILASLFLENKV